MFDHNPLTTPRALNAAFTQARIATARMVDPDFPNTEISDDKVSPEEIATPLVQEFLEWLPTNDEEDFRMNFMEKDIVAAHREIPAVMVFGALIHFLRTKKDYTQEDINKIITVTANTEGGI